MKVLLLADIPGWIVDRIADRMIAGMPEIEICKGYYACLRTNEILSLARLVDVIHYGNWDINRHWPRILDAGKPMLMSVRSHRYPPYVREVAKQVHVHVVNRALQAEFPGSHYIPDGCMIEPRPLRVGFAGKPGTYKGTHLIEQACRETGAEFVTADAAPEDMPAWFRSIDVYCCASEAEGHSTPVIEALAMNKPVVSTRVGEPYHSELPGITWVDRTVEGIAAGLLKHWPARQLDTYRWPAIYRQFEALYRKLA